MKISNALVLLLFVLRCHGEIDLGTCNLQCKGDSSSTATNNLPPSLQGRPGKQGAVGAKGAIGQKGQKGDPAEKCQCLDINDLKEKLFSRSCGDIRSLNAASNSGVYTIQPEGFGDVFGLRVYCDMVTDNDGWLVFQRRMDGSENFFRNFDDYVKGFGSLKGEFWFGLHALHELTKNGGYELRIYLEDFDNETRYAQYSTFIVGRGSNYTLNIGGYSGTAGDAMATHQGARFSAKDRDQDNSTGQCSQLFKGGWWYQACHASNLNGLYLRGPHDSYADGINWLQWRGHHYSLKKVEMKLRMK